ncbi:general substrate transporter [Aaosphaeria arxii CBS 175.79]|uniref:General substrate transporter n=1 Tax=Aaosphaeria arxii CBS 175.79 TaxID=1450172 RepID=A0A6A5XZ08_9PLEO|nr:general substrate transporter [Aaosphaeria arxii CBS 175.79]KAF2018528.1 general substrate transporter [Aaosphaeria arxii CBS 175.79]
MSIITRLLQSGGDNDGHSKKLNAYNAWMILFVSIGSLCYGYTANVISATLAQPTFLTYFELDTRSDALALISATNGIFQTGGVLGTLTLAFFSDKFGRKGGLAISALLILISGALLAGSVNIGMFLAFRFFAGAGAFMILAAVPIWMAEVVPPYLRGALVQIHAIVLVLGYNCASWLGFGIFHWENGGSATWRIPFAIQCFWPLCLLIGLYWCPESPRWLILNGRNDEAHKILLRLHNDAEDPEHTFARTEFLSITKQLAIDRTLPSSWMHIFRKPSLRKRALITIGTTGFIQCSGILVVNNYGPLLYKNLGYDTRTQLLYGAAWLTFAVGLNAMGAFLNDHYPRNKFMSIGVLGCMIVLSVEAGIIANVAKFIADGNGNGLRAGVAFLFLIEIPYDFFLNGMQFIYISEVWPMHLRAKGMSLGVAMISLMNIVWLQSAPEAFANIGWKFYLAFIVPGTIGSVVMWLFFPDTLGLPLEEVAAIFGDHDEANIKESHTERIETVA